MKDEIKKFKSDPFGYIKKERKNNRIMILKDQHKLEIEYKARYVRGQG
jgi:hypothetical protein